MVMTMQSSYLSNPDLLFDYFRSLLNIEFRGTHDLLLTLSEALVDMPNQPIDFHSFSDLIGYQMNIDLTRSQRTYLRRFLQNVADAGGPIRFILPHKTHFVFFDHTGLSEKASAVAIARMCTYLHLSEQIALPVNFNAETISDIDQEILKKIS